VDRDDAAPTLYLLSGLPGTGKSTLARSLEARGVTRLSVDDLVRRQHGRAGVDYPLSDHLPRLEQTLLGVRAELGRLLAAGSSVVLDHGLGRRAEREAFARLAEQHGARRRLLLLRADREELLRRLAGRDPADGFGPMDAALLDAVAACSDEPCGEGEEVVVDGQLPPGKGPG
jgi:predicted kinase